MKMIPILMAVPLLFLSCSSDNDTFDSSHIETLQPAVHLVSDLKVDMNTDKGVLQTWRKL
jgi:hypothetical protein